nr:phage tail assembly protein [uncultured Mediterranean phage uvMED]
MLRKVKLYGKLAEFVGHKEFDVEVNNVGQAVSFLLNNFPQLEQYMSPKYYQVKVGNFDIDESEIHYPVGQEDIHFVPAITGAGRGGLGKILLGAALIGAAFLMPAGSGLTLMQGIKAGSLAKVGLLTKTMLYVGASLALQGVSELLFPLPKDNGFDSEQDPQLSFSFSGLQNTSRAGTPVPIVYGEIMTGSVVISAAIDTNQVEA